MGRKLPHDLQEKPLGNSFNFNMPKKIMETWDLNIPDENKGGADLEKPSMCSGFGRSSSNIQGVIFRFHDPCWDLRKVSSTFYARYIHDKVVIPHVLDLVFVCLYLPMKHPCKVYVPTWMVYGFHVGKYTTYGSYRSTYKSNWSSRYSDIVSTNSTKFDLIWSRMNQYPCCLSLGISRMSSEC